MMIFLKLYVKKKKKTRRGRKDKRKKRTYIMSHLLLNSRYLKVFLKLAKIRNLIFVFLEIYNLFSVNSNINNIIEKPLCIYTRN